MRQSQAFLHTLRDDPADAEVVSHRLLARAGFIQKLAAGIYSYAPAMTRVLQRVSQIVREEMNRQGAQEVLLPILQPKEIWEESGRWERVSSLTPTIWGFTRRLTGGSFRPTGKGL